MVIKSILKLTNSVEPSSSCEGARRSAMQKNPINLGNPNVQKTPQLVFILSQKNPAHTTQSYFSKTHFNIILAFTSKFPQIFLQKFFMHSAPVRTTRSSDLVLLD
jgi:hypothetical protein